MKIIYFLFLFIAQISVAGNPPKWEKYKCAGDPITKYTQNSEIGIFANHQNEANLAYNNIVKWNEIVNVKKCKYYKEVASDILKLNNNAKKYMDFIAAYGGVIDGGLRRHFATCVDRIQEKI